MDWSTYYPAFVAQNFPENSDTQQNETSSTLAAPKSLTKDVEIVDIGCGFGGLLVALSPRLPDSLILGTSVPATPVSKGKGRRWYFDIGV